VPLDYNRSNTVNFLNYTDSDWKPWIDNLHNGQYDKPPTDDYSRFQDAKIAQPILSDITFTEESGMVLGFIDRTLFMTGYSDYAPETDNTDRYEYDAGGETLRICKTATGYVVEGNTGCDSHTNKDGYSEYFIGDIYDHSEDNRIHNETNLGGLLHKQGTSEVVTTAYDPVNKEGSDGFYRSGVEFLSMGSGDQIGGQLLNGDGTSTGKLGGYGKTGGMGDIELMADPAPIEIGNYVWFDKDGDGIQDPDEDPIAGVKVYLYDGDTLVGTATTDADGHYYFGGPDDTNGHVKPHTDYQIRIALDDDALDGKVVTAKDTTSDSADSDGDDGVLNNGFTTIAYTTGAAGQNNHDLDFGFVIPKVAIGSLVWDDTNNNGIQDDGEKGIQGATVTLLDENGDPVAGVDPVTTDENGKYCFCDLPEGTYKVKVTPPSDDYKPSDTQNGADNDDTANDSNIAEDNGDGSYTSGAFELKVGDEPTNETGGLDGSDED
jgi:hypothetical protein